MVIAVPVGHANLRRRIAWMVAGGPIASFLAGGVLLALDSPPARLAGGFSLLLGLLSGIPAKAAGFCSDGARLLMLLRNGPIAQRWAAITTLGGLAYSEVRPRDWPQTLLDQATAVDDRSYDTLSANVLAYYSRFDRGEIEGAGAHLDHGLELLDQAPRPFRGGILLEAVCFYALHHDDRAGLQHWLDEAAGGLLIETYTRLHAETAVLLAEGRIDQAAAKLEEALREIQGAPNTGLRTMEQECPRQLHARITPVIGAASQASAARGAAPRHLFSRS
jgi:hypothetical protein